MTPEEQAAALAEFPELRRLMDLRDAGWVFMTIVNDGEIIEVRGVHTWPEGWADAILVRYVTDAAALRCDDTAGIVWQRDGGLVEVVDALLALPPPSDPNAPRLVRGAAPKLWTS